MAHQASDDDMATVKIDRGSVSISDSTIINTANTGTALWVEGSAASIDNIVVKNGAVGIMSKNAAPQTTASPQPTTPSVWTWRVA